MAASNPGQPSFCANCGMAMDGRFCANCGNDSLGVLNQIFGSSQASSTQATQSQSPPKNPATYSPSSGQNSSQPPPNQSPRQPVYYPSPPKRTGFSDALKGLGNGLNTCLSTVGCLIVAILLISFLGPVGIGLVLVAAAFFAIALAIYKKS